MDAIAHRAGSPEFDTVQSTTGLLFLRRFDGESIFFGELLRVEGHEDSFGIMNIDSFH